MKLLLVSLLFLIASCSTRFTGDAHLTPKQCQNKCESWGMELDGMVAMGEYSDACVCTKRKNTTMNHTGVGGGAVGVILQKMKDDEQNHSMMVSF